MHAVAAALLVLAGAAATPAAAEDRALVVGIGRYREPGANLPGIDKDVAMMRETLRLLGFRDSQVKVIENEDATLAGIERAFQTWLVDAVGPADRAVFYFSGHGTRVADRDGDEPDRLDEVLVPHDFTAGTGEPRNALVDDLLGQWLARIRSRRVAVLIDACHSGSATRAFIRDKFLPYATMPPLPAGKSSARKDLDVGDRNASAPANYVAVSAADDSEVAQASEDGSLFTLGVIKAVRDATAASRPISMLTIKEVSTAVVREIEQRAGRRPHTPQISGDVARAGENLLAPSLPAPTPPAPLPPAPPPPGGSLWSVLEGLVDRVAPERRLAISSNQPEFRMGDRLELAFDVAIDGYMNIFNVGDGEDDGVVLFPNQFQSDNRVRAGDRVRVPAGSQFKLPARLPQGVSAQRNLVVVILTTKPLDAYRLGSGQSFLRALSGATARSFAVEAGDGDYFAGKLLTVISR